MTHDRVARDDQRVKLVRGNACPLADRPDGAVNALLQHGIDLVSAWRHGVVHARQDVAAESDLRIFEAHGENGLLRPIVVEEQDHVGRAQIEGKRIGSFPAHVDQPGARLSPSDGARKRDIARPERVGKPVQERKRDFEAVETEGVAQALVMGAAVIGSGQRERNVLLNDEGRHE